MFVDEIVSTVFTTDRTAAKTIGTKVLNREVSTVFTTDRTAAETCY